MSEFNFDEPERKSSSVSLPALNVWDILSIGVLLIIACLVVYFVMIFFNPTSPFNPFQPEQSNAPVPTVTPIQMQPTWTPTPTVYFSPTATFLPTITPPATITPASLAPLTDTPVPTKTLTVTPTPKAPFSVSSVNAIESVIIPHLQTVGCNWQGVGGTVDDQNGSSIIGLVVRLGGSLNGKSIELTTVSGVSEEYGKSGFEFVLGDTPVNSRDTIYVQLLDQAGLPLSEKVYINTFSDCEKNLILIRFKKNR
jgi:hypothetical protein